MLENNAEIMKFEQKYILSDKTIGDGMNGSIYECQSKRNNKIFALKILRMDKMALREVELHFRCSICENVVNVIDVFKNYSTGNLYLVMERMNGDLFERYPEFRTYDEAEKAAIMFQICNAVQFLHSNDIAHRDLKLENILLTDASSNANLKLADFGFAKICKSNKKMLTTPIGTISYSGPEILSFQHYDKACDLWAIGVILYLILYSKLPFNTYTSDLSPTTVENIMTANYLKQKKGIASQDAMDLVALLIKADPEERPTIGEVIESKWIKNGARNQIDLFKSRPRLTKNENPRMEEMKRSVTEKLAEMRNRKTRRSMESVVNPLNQNDPLPKARSYPKDFKEIAVLKKRYDYADSKISKTLGQIKQITKETMESEHKILEKMVIFGAFHISEQFNKERSRYKEEIYDRNLVRLSDKTFIYAAFIDGFEMKKTYIATEIPTEITCNSFWQMVYENNICILVLMTKITDDPIYGVQYWPLNSEDIMKFKEYEIKFLNKSNIDGIDVIDIEITSFKEKKQKIVKQFCCPWEDVLENQDYALFLKFINLVNKTHVKMNSETPKLIICRSGKGRSAAFIAIDIALKVLDRHGKVDLKHIATLIREQFPRAFNLIDHYIFLHDVIKSLAKN